MADTFQEIQKLQAQIDDLREKAKDEAVKKVRAALEQLNALGFHFELSEKGAKKKATKPMKDAVCSVCGFKTSPPHDPRTHKAQGSDKKPFTKKELEERGLAKV